jgi:hypothetical protein
MIGYRLGEGWVRHMDRVAAPQKMVGAGIFSKITRTGLFQQRMILRTAAARPCRSSGCDCPPSCVAFCLPPMGGINSRGCRLLASSIPW